MIERPEQMRLYNNAACQQLPTLEAHSSNRYLEDHVRHHFSFLGLFEAILAAQLAQARLSQGARSSEWRCALKQTFGLSEHSVINSIRGQK